jgi:hypothetical protein
LEMTAMKWNEREGVINPCQKAGLPSTQGIWVISSLWPQYIASTTSWYLNSYIHILSQLLRSLEQQFSSPHKMNLEFFTALPLTEWMLLLGGILSFIYLQCCPLNILSIFLPSQKTWENIASPWIFSPFWIWNTSLSACSDQSPDSVCKFIETKFGDNFYWSGQFEKIEHLHSNLQFIASSFVFSRILLNIPDCQRIVNLDWQIEKRGWKVTAAHISISKQVAAAAAALSSRCISNCINLL